jgi:hypothetical protein
MPTSHEIPTSQLAVGLARACSCPLMPMPNRSSKQPRPAEQSLMRVISPASAPPPGGVDIPWREVINPTLPPLDTADHDLIPPSWNARRPLLPTYATPPTTPAASCPHDTAQKAKSGRTHTEPPFVLPDLGHTACHSPSDLFVPYRRYFKRRTQMGKSIESNLALP